MPFYESPAGRHIREMRSVEAERDSYRRLLADLVRSIEDFGSPRRHEPELTAAIEALGARS